MHRKFGPGACDYHLISLGRVARRKLQTPGTAKEPKSQGTPTINTNNRQPAQLIDQAPGTIETEAQESLRIIPTPRHHYANSAGPSPDPLKQRSPMRSTGGLSRTTTQTPPAPGRHAAPPARRASGTCRRYRSGRSSIYEFPVHVG